MQNNHIDFGRLGEIMSQVEESGAILLVHSEDDEMVHYNYDRLKMTDEWDWWNMHRIHTNQSEDLSFRRVTRLAERTNCSIYFVHVSAKEGVNEIKRCRSLGLPIYGETLHNYVCFTSDNYREDNGMKFHTYPSLRVMLTLILSGLGYWMARFQLWQLTWSLPLGKRKSNIGP